VWVARHGARWREVPANAEVVARDVPFDWVRAAHGRPVAPGDGSWLDRWQGLAREPGEAEGGPRAVAAEALDSARSDHVLLLGSSGPIRAADAVMRPLRVVEMPRIVANRGLAGIDGTVSTAVGLALAGIGRVTALMGDVTFLHDIGGLLVGRREKTPDLRIVVANDGGGTIFRGLEHVAAPDAAFERVFTTPHSARLEDLCSGYGVTHALVGDRAELRAALEHPPTGIEVVEAALP